MFFHTRGSSGDQVARATRYKYFFTKCSRIVKYHHRRQEHHFKVLLRRNFDVMFITKNHLYQLIKEDCNSVNLIEMKIFTPQTGKNWP